MVSNVSSGTKRILVVGAGISGISAALALAEANFQVDMVERAPALESEAVGLWLASATFRALRALNVFDAVAARAFLGGELRVCSEAGDAIIELPAPRPVEPGLPSGGAIMLGELRAILAARVEASGVEPRFGITVASIAQDAEGVDVIFDDGVTQRYDLVIGADGLRSPIRELVHPGSAAIEYTGQYLWRAHLPRDPGIDIRHVFSGGPIKVGLSPLADDMMYLFVLQIAPSPALVQPAERHIALRALLAGYGGPIAAVRDRLDPETTITACPWETLRFSEPWATGRVILVGDAVHPVTPQIGSGVGLAIEDAVVLRDELAKHGLGPLALSHAAARRQKRCRRVLENSQEIIRRQNAGGSPGALNALLDDTFGILAQPF